jgi:branched-chain amino acid aminotransferase
MFGAGTAAVITAIGKFSHRDEEFELPKLEERYSDMFKKKLTDIQYNRTQDKFGWRYLVE